MRPITYTRRAADLERLEAFIASRSPTAAKRSAARLLKGIRLLMRVPDMGVSVGDGYRQLVLAYGKSGYVVRYRIENDGVVIVRIWRVKEDRKDSP